MNDEISYAFTSSVSLVFLYLNILSSLLTLKSYLKIFTIICWLN